MRVYTQPSQGTHTNEVRTVVLKRSQVVDGIDLEVLTPGGDPIEARLSISIEEAMKLAADLNRAVYTCKGKSFLPSGKTEIRLEA